MGVLKTGISKSNLSDGMKSRRDFLKKIMTGGVMFAAASDSYPIIPVQKKSKGTTCTLYRSINGTPEDNLVKVIEMMGGIGKLIGSDDVVIIKPNVQWWNQGCPNLSALNKLVDLIMARAGGFEGEVVIAENCHLKHTSWAPMVCGWSRPFQLNSDLPGISHMNDLCDILKKRYGSRFSLVHWIDVDIGAKRIFTPADGDGYIYCDGTGGVPLISCDNGVNGDKSRATIMTYPVFTTDRGTRVDFKNGIWDKGEYLEQPLRFINFAALNHHSTYCGATSAVKNYLGISDLSGGPDPYNNGRLTDKYYNFHSFPFDKWEPGIKPGMLGKEIGIFMKTIRKADLNITTAEWAGLSHRTIPPVAHTRAVLVCNDPVALDYHSTKYILFPNSKIGMHNPDNKATSLYQDLLKCSESSGSVLNEENVKVVSYDLKKGCLQMDNELAVFADKKWGSDVKQAMKYLVLRYFY